MELLPNEITNIIKEFTIFKPKIKEELQEAVDLWCENKNVALKKYGNISNWNTSLITDMSRLFIQKRYFNDNINNWDVSSVTNMEYLFWQATSFNQPLGSWDVSKVTNMKGMFLATSSFNQPLDSWDVSSVTIMEGMLS